MYKLGVAAGIDEMSSSARMNQYERGKHEPDFSMVERVPRVLNVPECYFYCKDDDVARILVDLHRAPEARRIKASPQFRISCANPALAAATAGCRPGPAKKVTRASCYEAAACSSSSMASAGVSNCMCASWLRT